MNDAKTYHGANALQKRDAYEALEAHVKKIKWMGDDVRVMDIGCGDGSVTTQVLRKYLPKRYKELVGCDISEKMVEFANEKYSDNNTSFEVVDIEGTLPLEMEDAFDHVFSFYVLHWIKDQKRVFMNIHNLLTEGGDCLLVFLGNMPVFDVYRQLAKSNKWSQWLSNVERFVSPYHDSPNPAPEVASLMERVGFKNIDVNCEQKEITYESLAEIKKALKAVNPFKIPEDSFEDFMEDYMEVMKDMRLMDKMNNNIEDHVAIKANYTLIIAYGSK